MLDLLLCHQDHYFDAVFPKNCFFRTGVDKWVEKLEIKLYSNSYTSQSVDEIVSYIVRLIRGSILEEFDLPLSLWIDKEYEMLGCHNDNGKLFFHLYF